MGRRVASCRENTRQGGYLVASNYISIDRSFMPPFRPLLGRSGDPLPTRRPPSATVLPASPVSQFLPTGVTASSANCKPEPRLAARTCRPRTRHAYQPRGALVGVQSAPTIGLIRVDERFRCNFDPISRVFTIRDATGAVLVPWKFLGRQADERRRGRAFFSAARNSPLTANFPRSVLQGIFLPAIKPEPDRSMGSKPDAPGTRLVERTTGRHAPRAII